MANLPRLEDREGRMKSLVIKKRKVALVDDESGILQLFHHILNEQYEIFTFNNPKTFLETLVLRKPKPFDILITDFRMPQMTGLEMIRQAQTNGFFFPSIIFSGHLDKKAIIEAVDLGVFRLLEKPTSPDVVISAIEELFVEYEIRETRDEIRKITAQMREYYSFIRLLISAHIPETEVQNFSLQIDPQGEVRHQESFDHLMDQLEDRLEGLLKSETVLEDVRAKRYKNIA